MVKDKNKGFTLVELLAVLVILGVIVTIAIPTVSSTLNKQKDKELKNRQQDIVSSAELYLDKIRTNLNGGKCCTVNNLVQLNIISEKQSKLDDGTAISGGVYFDSNHELKFKDRDCSGCVN